MTSLHPEKSRVAALLCLVVLLLSGCASVMSRATSGLANDLAATILNSQDIETVREGVPAYLLMIDSFLRSSPDNPDLLLAASSLNGAFSTFTGPERAKLLTQKSLDYALQAACIQMESWCGLRGTSFAAYQGLVEGLDKKDISVAYALAVAWVGWIQAHSDDWNAVADLERVKLLMRGVLELDESHDAGRAHLYMGGLETLLPAAMGGRPEVGRQHFERALVLSDGKFLMTQVIFAEQYARLVFDKELHDRLLQEVLAADPVVEGMTLTNTVAQQRAKALLAESDAYF